MKSVNIRLSPADVRVVAKLKRDGRNISEIARAAFHAASGSSAVRKPKTVKDVEKILAELDAKYTGPPPEYVQLGIDVTDRKQMRAYLQMRRDRKLRRRAS